MTLSIDSILIYVICLSSKIWWRQRDFVSYKKKASISQL